MARAALLADAGETPRAAALVARALAPSDADGSGWVLPIEPLLDVRRRPDSWHVALATLRGRAM